MIPDPRPRHLPLVAMAAVLLLAGTAGASLTGSLHADAAYFDAGEQSGPAVMAWIQNSGTDSGPVAVAVEAASVEGTQYERRTPVVRVTPAVGGLLPPLEASLIESEPVLTHISAHNATLQVADQGDLLTFSIRELSPGSLRLHAGLGSFAAHPFDGAAMSSGGITRDLPPPTSTSNEPDSFSRIEVGEPIIFSEGSHLTVRMVLEGDFVLEAFDADFLMRNETTEQVLVSKPRHEPLHQDAPDEATTVAFEAVDAFLRLEFRDARLELQAPYFEGAVEWALRSAHIEPHGMVTLLNASGSLRGDGNPVLRGERFTMDGGPAMDLASEGERLGVRLVPAAQEEGLFARGVFVAPPDSLGTGALWASGVLALLSLLVFTTRAAMRAGRLPQLSDIEADIGSGRYDRAARRAGRILRRQPSNEAAAVARAVALSRSGRHSRVVDEVEGRLARQDATDGVLHYLLGLSYRKLDRPAEAFKAFNEAVRRTPSLEEEVEKQLGGSPVRREPTAGNGYT